MTNDDYAWPQGWLRYHVGRDYFQPTDPPDDVEAALIDDQEVQVDEMGHPVVDWAQCGNCLRWWNDAAISYVTPAPSGRCPFEYEHEDVLAAEDLAQSEPV